MFKQVLKLKKRRTAVLWLLVIVLVLPMILFFQGGFRSLSQPGPGGTAGVLFGREVPWETFQQEHQTVRRAIASQFGDVPEALEGLVRQQTWDRLMLQAEARRRVRVSDEEVARYLQGQPTFQQQGRFVPELYFHFVRGLGLTPQAFEEHVRSDLQVQRLLERIRNEVTITEAELAKASAEAQERVRAKLVLVRGSDVEARAAAAVSDADVQAYYDGHHDLFRQPATRTVEAVGRSAEEAKVQPSSTEADASKKLLTTLALDLQDHRDAGESLEQIAAAVHVPVQQMGAVDQDGVQPLPKGMHPSMLAAIFDTPIGKLSEVARAEEGVFIFRPVSETPAGVTPLDQVRAEARRLVVQEKARELARRQAESLRTALLAAQQAGQSLSQAAAAANLKVLAPEPVKRQDAIPPLGQVPSLSQTLFALQPQTLSSVVQIPDGAVVGWIEERLAVSADDIAQHQESMRPQLLAAKQQARVAAWIEEVRARAKLKSYLEPSEAAGASR